MFHVGEGFAAGLRTNMFMMLARGAAHKKWGRGGEKRCLSERRSRERPLHPLRIYFFALDARDFRGCRLETLGREFFRRFVARYLNSKI